jgi:cytochrome P450
MVVSPYNFYVNCTDADLNTQITSRKADFVKPIASYALLNLFGKNMLSSEGEDWKRHRKIVAPSFSDKSNALVWEESIRQMNGLIKLWARTAGNTMDDMKVANLDPEWSLLALHVICAAGFGVPQRWPGEDEQSLGSKIVPGFNTEKLLNGHTLTFKKSLAELSEKIILFWAFSPQVLSGFPSSSPHWIITDDLIERMPFEFHQNLYTAYAELKQYLNELVEDKTKKMNLGLREEQTMDLLGK